MSYVNHSVRSGGDRSTVLACHNVCAGLVLRRLAACARAALRRSRHRARRLSRGQGVECWYGLRRWAAVAVGLSAAAPRRHLVPAASTVCVVDIDRRCASSCAAAQTRGTGPADAPGLGWPVGVPSYRVGDDAITLGRFGMDAAVHAYTYEAIARYCNSHAAMPSAVCGNAATTATRAPYVAVVRCFGRCTFSARLSTQGFGRRSMRATATFPPACSSPR